MIVTFYAYFRSTIAYLAYNDKTLLYIIAGSFTGFILFFTVYGSQFSSGIFRGSTHGKARKMQRLL